MDTGYMKTVSRLVAAVAFVGSATPGQPIGYRVTAQRRDATSLPSTPVTPSADWSTSSESVTLKAA
jgi:hypothetical protein